MEKCGWPRRGDKSNLETSRVGTPSLAFIQRRRREMLEPFRNGPNAHRGKDCGSSGSKGVGGFRPKTRLSRIVTATLLGAYTGVAPQ